MVERDKELGSSSNYTAQPSEQEIRNGAGETGSMNLHRDGSTSLTPSATEKKSDARKSKIIKTLSMGFYSKVVGIVVSFAMAPLAVNYLGSDGYGLWIAASSLIALLSFADGGAGNALLNMVSHAAVASSKESLKSIVSSGFFVLLSISIIGALLFLLLTPHVNWVWVFGITEGIQHQELQSLVLIVGLAFFIGMPFSVVGNVQKGFQEGNIQEFWNAKGRLLSFVFVCVSIHFDLGLTGFALAIVLGPIVAALCNNTYYFAIRKKELWPALSSVKRADVNTVLSIGSLFFFLQITASIQISADNIIIANILGPSAVTQYAVCMQLAMVVPVTMGLLWAPLWPAYREALASGDIAWVKRVFFKSLKLALSVGMPSAIILVLFGQETIELWVGDELIPSMLLLVGCGIWLTFLLVGGVFNVFFNAIQLIKAQIIMAVCSGLSNILITIFLVEKIGISGAIYGTIVAYFLCVLLPCVFMVSKVIKNIEINSSVGA